ncbi:MAG: NAD(P)H-hydrate epimerase, partial [Burkholderiales bacterium]
MTVRFAHETPIYRTADVRAIEAAAATAPPLMERAGLAAAEIARDVSGGTGKPVLVLAGPGNNGGDAFVVARTLHQRGVDLSVFLVGQVAEVKGDARINLE